MAGAALLAQALEPPRHHLHLQLPALTSFSLPGAGGFPFCCKQSVDVTETQ